MQPLLKSSATDQIPKNISHNEIIVTDETNQRFTEGSPVSCPASPNE